MKASTSATPAARLFVALCPPPAVRAALAAWRSHWAWPSGVALVEPADLHLTLHFIGMVPRDRVPELVRRMALPAPRCTLEFGRAELWPRGIAVCCPVTWPPAMAELHAHLADALRRAAVPVEVRPYRPHLTLARKAAGAIAPASPLALRWAVQSYALMESQRGYRAIARYGPHGLADLAAARQDP
jgi:RNA 2',3'-cyclic 3'-phosphodiesterase